MHFIKNNILHRDLKWANVFLNKDGTVKLGDLNVSKVAKMGLVYTQTGTPYYASPEVWQDKPYDNRSDIWSLGWVIYEMITLRPPFTASSMQELCNKVKKGVYPKIPTIFSRDLSTLISTLLQVSPLKRPSWEQILHMPVVEEHLTDEETKEIWKDLLNTIKIPRNMNLLKDKLPASQYENEKVEEEVESTYEEDFEPVNSSKHSIPPTPDQKENKPNPSLRNLSRGRTDRPKRKPKGLPPPAPIPVPQPPLSQKHRPPEAPLPWRKSQRGQRVSGEGQKKKRINPKTTEEGEKPRRYQMYRMQSREGQPMEQRRRVDEIYKMRAKEVEMKEKMSERQNLQAVDRMW